MSEGSAQPLPGWVALVNGDSHDLYDWAQFLKQPFDPYCDVIGCGGDSAWALRSPQFDALRNAGEVRERAIQLIERLNGALAASASAEPVKFDSVDQIDDQGTCHRTYFLIAETAKFRMRGGFATISVRDSVGNLVSPPAPEASDAQKWIQLAEQCDTVADMLVFAGRGDNWFDIYKVIELAEKLMGGKRKLSDLLASSAEQFKQMRETANFHRHARTYRPATLTTISEARPLLFFAVRTVLDKLDR